MSYIRSRTSRFGSLGAAGASDQGSAKVPASAAGPSASSWTRGRVAGEGTAGLSRPKISAMELLAFRPVDPMRPVVVPAEIDEKLPPGQPGKYHEQRFFFLVSELSKDPKFISRLSSNASMRWKIASAASQSLVDETLAATPPVTSQGQVTDPQAATVRSDLQVVSDKIKGAGQRIEQTADRFASQAQAQANEVSAKVESATGVKIDPAAVVDALKNEARPLMEEASALAEELLASVSSDVMEIANDVAGTIAPAFGPAGAALKVAQAVMEWFVAQENAAAEKAKASAEAVAKSMDQVADELDRRCRAYIVPTANVALGKAATPADLFRLVTYPVLFSGMALDPKLRIDPHEERRVLTMPDLGKAMLSIVAPDAFALETIQFINFWSSSASKMKGLSPLGEPVWLASTQTAKLTAAAKSMLSETQPLQVAYDKVLASYYTPNGVQRDASAFAAEVSEWIKQSQATWVSPWLYKQHRKAVVFGPKVSEQKKMDMAEKVAKYQDITAQLAEIGLLPAVAYTDAFFSPVPMVGMVNLEPRESGIDLRAFKLHGWLFSRPTLHPQPAPLVRGQAWPRAPWSIRRVANQIRTGYILPNFQWYASLWVRIPGDDVSSVCEKNGFCHLISYDRRAGGKADKLVKEFSALLEKYKFPLLASVAHEGLPTRWNPEDNDDWFKQLKKQYSPSQDPYNPASKDRSKWVSYYWPERRPIVRDENWKPRVWGFDAPPIDRKADGSPLLTYGVSPRTRSLFLLMYRLIMEESGEKGEQGAKIMPFFVDLLLYELDSGRITDESICAILATVFPTWDQNKSPRNSLYQFLHYWQGMSRPYGKDDVEKLQTAQRKVLAVTSMFVDNPGLTLPFLSEQADSNFSKQDVTVLTQKYLERKKKRDAARWARAKRFVVAARSTKQPGSAGPDGASAAAATLYGEANGAQTGSGIPGWAIALVSLAAVGGGAYYLMQRKSKSKRKA